ncbi:MAG: hypothetical protein FWE12_01085 [Oscillospiraceae bacterium]|nr:hypothetical protein [Oscillospiraceae bacterium]
MLVFEHLPLDRDATEFIMSPEHFWGDKSETLLDEGFYFFTLSLDDKT